MAALVRQAVGGVEAGDAEVNVAVWVAQFVEPKARGLGFDRLLLAKMLDVCSSKGYEYLLFVVDNRTPELHSMLRSHYLSQGCLELPEPNPLGIQRGMLRAVRAPLELASKFPAAPPALPPADAELGAAPPSLSASDGGDAHCLRDAALASGINLAANAFLLIHGYVCMPLLLELVQEVAPRWRSRRGCTLEEISVETGAHPGPLAVLLRAALVLGAVRAEEGEGDAGRTRRFRLTLEESPEVLGLQTLCAREPGVPLALRRIYEEAQPPFQMATPAARLCLEVWTTQRPRWRNCDPALRVLLDGVVLSPLLTSLVYLHRWDETGVERVGADSELELARTGLEPGEGLCAALDGALKEIGVGACDAEGVVRSTPAGALALRRTYTFFAGTSYSPLLARTHHVLFQDPAWGFVGVGQDTGEKERHVNRTLNVVGSGAQHKTFFNDLAALLRPLFLTPDAASQPAFIVDTGCGDGQLLAQLYAFVRDKTPRGQVLDRYPLKMVGVDFNEESRRVAAANLAARGVPHEIVPGDIGDPQEICLRLAEASVDCSRALHVRSFLDHDRPFLAPQLAAPAAGARGAFVREQFADAVHLDKSGRPLSGAEVYQSLVEHLQRWGRAVEGSHGLCLLEVLLLDVPSTQRNFNHNVSFHFDLEEALSRQYLVPPMAFISALAEAGLFAAASSNSARCYPESGDYCRILCLHLARRPFRVRLAEAEDVEQLLHLEVVGVAENLRADRRTLAERLRRSPCGNFVAEADGDGRLLAAIYSTRAPSESGVQAEAIGPAEGPVVQIVGLTASPDAQGVGALLRDFLLLLARVDASATSVIGITRCEGWRRSPDLPIEEYVEQHKRGEIADKILSFHTARGAEIVGVLRGARPWDEDNAGAGVLIRYDPKALFQSTRPSSSSSSSSSLASPSRRSAVVDASACVRRALEEVGVLVEQTRTDVNAAQATFVELGLDSLDLMRIRETLSRELGADIPAAAMFDHPTVAGLTRLAEQRLAAARGGPAATAAGLAAAAPSPADAGRMVSLVTSALQGLDLPSNEGGDFLALGLDSLDLARLRDKLSERLGAPLPSTVCLDFPSVPSLAAHLTGPGLRAG